MVNVMVKITNKMVTKTIQGCSYNLYERIRKVAYQIQ